MPKKKKQEPSFEQMQEFFRQVDKGRMTSEIFQVALTHPDELLKIARAKKVRAKSAVTHSFADLLSACKQNYVSDYFNEKNFPLEPIASDESEWEVYEYHFGYFIHGLNAFKELKERGYRLCGPRRAMEYIANGHLKVQLDHTLIVTTRLQFSSGSDWFAPVFRREDCDKGNLNLYNLNDSFNPHFGWLVLRKKQS